MIATEEVKRNRLFVRSVIVFELLSGENETRNDIMLPQESRIRSIKKETDPRKENGGCGKSMGLLNRIIKPCSRVKTGSAPFVSVSLSYYG